ncbi:hypothetical protein LG275_03960 [Chryseomicrobium palamuruense]
MQKQVEEIISKMCIAEIQKTFGVSKMTAMQMKRGKNVRVDLMSALSFFSRMKPSSDIFYDLGCTHCGRAWKSPNGYCGACGNRLIPISQLEQFYPGRTFTPDPFRNQ